MQRRFRARQLPIDGTSSTMTTVLRTVGIVAVFIGTGMIIHKMVGKPTADAGIALLVAGGLTIAAASRGENA